MNHTPLWLRLTFAACVLVPALAGAYALVHRDDCTKLDACRIGKAFAFGPLGSAFK